MNRKMTITSPVKLEHQASQRQELPRAVLLGLASGIFFLTFFGAFWGFISAAFMSGTFQVFAFILVGTVSLSFFGTGPHGTDCRPRGGDVPLHRAALPA
jgi:hypothetical protein